MSRLLHSAMNYAGSAKEVMENKKDFQIRDSSSPFIMVFPVPIHIFPAGGLGQ